MGSAIHCFFPRSIDQNPDVVREALTSAFVELQDELRILDAKGRTSKLAGEWWIIHQPAEKDTPAFLMGEGPCGFLIDVYEKTIVLVNGEYFHAIEFSDRLGIAGALQKVVSRVANVLGDSTQIAITAGGLGDTDQAEGIASLEAGTFGHVCSHLEAKLGPPATTWESLNGNDHAWYLGPTV